MLPIIAGAILFIVGLLMLFRQALNSRRLSDPHGSSAAGAKPTLEPRGQGVGFLGISRNWAGLALMTVGAILLIAGTSS